MKNKQKSFSLIELLVVIAIIGILASIIVVSAGQAKKNARNAKRLADIRNYINAFEMALDENGEYPDPGDMNWYCLGTGYEDGGCWGLDYYESPILNNILDDFIALPIDDYPIKLMGNDYDGYLYGCRERLNDVCSKIAVYWFMEGNNQSCGVGEPHPYDTGYYCTYETSF